jgi:hypothetical protein
MNDARMVRIATLWERVSAKGTKYYSGYMGDCQLLMFDGGEKPHPTRPGERVRIWRLMVQEKDPDRRPGASRRPVEAPGEAPGARGAANTFGSRPSSTGSWEPSSRLDDSELAVDDLTRGRE